MSLQVPNAYTSPSTQYLPLPSPHNASASITNDLNSNNLDLGISAASVSTSVQGSNAQDNNSAGTRTLSKSFTAFEPAIHAARNPLLPTQEVRSHAPKRILTPAQSRTMNEAKAAKQREAMLLKLEIVALYEEHEAKIAALAKKHCTTSEYITRLATAVSELKRKRAPGRMQALLHIKAKEVNSSKFFVHLM